MLQFRAYRHESICTRTFQDIGVLRQTVQQSQSMDITDESGGRRDGQSTLAAATATSEARIRTLNNKVDSKHKSFGAVPGGKGRKKFAICNGINLQGDAAFACYNYVHYVCGQQKVDV